MQSLYKISILFFLAITLGSCKDDFLTVAPKDLLTDANFYLTEADAQNSLTGVYAALQQEQTFSNVRDAADIDWQMTGDMYGMDGNLDRVTIASLILPANNTIFRDVYRGAYAGIGRANSTIGRVEGMENIDPEVKKLIIGQAKFLRGLFYYRLVSYFGGVPLVITELDASSKLDVPRSSAEEVWKQVEADFKDAADVLPVKWPSANDLGRATKTAALGFLVKANMWQKKWNDAVTNSEAIINANTHQLLPNFRDIFLEINENNAEILFSTQFRAGTDGEGNNLSTRSAPRGAPSQFTGSAAWSNFVPEPQWVNAYEKDASGRIKDRRYWSTIIGPGEAHQNMPAFVMPANVPAGWSKTGFIVTKYWQQANINAQGVNAPVLRFAEVLLNYAEALNEVNRSPEAMALVNRIRVRAGLDPKSEDLAKEEVLDAIFYERRMEFIWEPAGAFTDLNRAGRFINFIRENRPDFSALDVQNKPWLLTQPILLPIPQEAWDNNKSLTQNPGYPSF
jgi:starch-binding outer membrane protein, SusD/RagB family